MLTPADELPAGPVTLRRWRADDLEEAHRSVTEALDHIRPWMAWAARGYTRTDAREFIARSRDHWEDGTEFNYAITVPGGAVIGSCGLMRIGPAGLEIGYWLHPDHTGRGYATAAAAALVAEAFRIGADHVEIVHDVANVRSGAVPRRLGFVEVTRRPPQEELTSVEAGEDVVWRILAPR